MLICCKNDVDLMMSCMCVSLYVIYIRISQLPNGPSAKFLIENGNL
jgi:hypothetical protein